MYNTKMNLFFSLIAAGSLLAISCDKKPETPAVTPDPQPEEPALIELVSPEYGFEAVLEECPSVSFEWKSVEGVSNYKLSVSLSQDMSGAYTVPALSNPLTFTSGEFDAVLENLGIESGTQRNIYWSIIPFKASDKAAAQTRRMLVTRLDKEEVKPGQNAEPIVHKIGIYYEDFYVGDTGKRLHEMCSWNDPHKQSKELAALMTEASHGVVQYQIVVEIEGEVPYAYYTEDHGTHKKGDKVTADICYNEFFKNRDYPGLYQYVKYDYAKMVADNGFDTLLNDGTIDEVWVYNHPGAGMFETCMPGPGAFWINGDCFDLSTLKRKCTVLFCNYERTTDLAMHSLAHKFENVMKKLYGRWDYNLTNKDEMNNWELFSAYNLVYDKFDKGASHIGNCHFPCNATSDYDYSNSSYVKTYCDAWETYPDLVFENPRTINSGEWGRSQMGYMKWFFSHVPHFAGLNPKDQHLNNWWYYFVDWDAAKSYERKLINQ